MICTSVTTVYKLDEVANCNCYGYCFEPQYINDNFPSKIRDKLLDIEGTKALKEAFSPVSQTGFQTQTLEEIFSFSLEDIELTPWKIGEVFAEFFLETERGVRFWYNHLRDLRNLKSNPTGADLIGFSDHGEETVFVFGEVKTSEDESSPPQVLYGKEGLKTQISELCLNPKVRNTLIRYMAFKAKDLPNSDPFYRDFSRALISYRKSNLKVHLIGILVRDTKYNQRDLEARYRAHLKTIDANMIIQFMALYLPIGKDKWVGLVKGEKKN